MLNLLSNTARLAAIGKTKVDYDELTVFSHLIEEIGEIGTCINNKTTKRKTLKEPITAECVDAINCLLELYFVSGGTIIDFYDVAAQKQTKWESSLNKLETKKDS